MKKIYKPHNTAEIIAAIRLIKKKFHKISRHIAYDIVKVEQTIRGRNRAPSDAQIMSAWGFWSWLDIQIKEIRKKEKWLEEHGFYKNNDPRIRHLNIIKERSR